MENNTLLKFDTTHSTISVTESSFDFIMLFPKSFIDSYSSLYSSSSSTSSSTTSTSLINVVHNYDNDICNKNTINTSNINDINNNIHTSIYAKNPLLKNHNYTIHIPNKVERIIERVIPTKLRKAIHPDLTVAKEFCLLFLSKLNSTYFEIEGGKDGWKNLNSKYLRKYFSTSSSTYKRIIEALEFEHIKGSIIVCDYKPKIGKKSHSFRLGDNYSATGFKPYKLSCNEARLLFDNDRRRMLKDAENNPICKNLFSFYEHIKLPKIEEIESEAKRLINIGYSKKGKVLKFRNKHGDSYFADTKKIAFVEDAILLYNYLTKDGLLIPQPTSEAAGYRVVDSLMLMPSWIRKLIKYKGKPIVESDYSALHPNIGIALYGGKTGFITHQKIAEQMGANEKEIKIEHLSFFNKKIWQMKASPLYKYYSENEPQMVQNLINEKQKGYKTTSTKMFKKEVQLMTSVIEQLNAKGIYVGYVYDALICSPQDSFEVEKTMNETAIKMGIRTVAKISSKAEIRIEPATVLSTEKENQKILELKLSQLLFDWQLKEEIKGDLEGLNVVQARIDMEDGTFYDEKVIVTKDSYSNKPMYVPYEYLVSDI